MAEFNNALWAMAKRWMPATKPKAQSVFWGCASNWRSLIDKGSNDAYDIRGRLYDLLSECEIATSPEDYNLMVGLGIASQIIRSVEEIHRRRINGHNRKTARGVMDEAFYALKRRKDDFGESLPIDQTANGVAITTVHQAKGLEWPIVIIPMLMSNRFPTRNRGHETSFPDEIAWRYGTSLDDERRLFYVATTRAKERLFLVDPVKYKSQRQSQFIKNLIERQELVSEKLSDIGMNTWIIAPEDLAEKSNPPLRIGLSDLLIYLECPYQYALRKIVAIQPSVGEELGYGKGLHELIQRRLEDATIWDEETLDQQVEENVFLPLMSEEGEINSKMAIKKRIKSLEKLDVFKAKVEPEVNVEVIISNGIIHGIIDMIEVKEDGTVRIRDWKSNIHDQLVLRYQRQLQLYAYALRQQGRNVTEADIVDVAASDKSGKLVVRIVDISEDCTNNLVEEMGNAINGISNGDFPTHPNINSCSCCDMYRICSERINQ